MIVQRVLVYLSLHFPHFKHFTLPQYSLLNQDTNIGPWLLPELQAPGPNTGHHAAFCHYVFLTSSGLWQFLGLSFMTSRVLRSTDQVSFSRILDWIGLCSYLICLILFFYSTGVMVFGKHATKMECPCHVSGGTQYSHDIPGDVNFFTWLSWSLPGFSTRKLLLFPFHTLVSGSGSRA